MAIASGEIKNEMVVTLLEATATNTATDWFRFRALRAVVEIVITGTKSVSFEGSLDGVTGLPAVIQGPITSSVAFTFSDPIPYIRVNPTSGTGTVAVKIST